MSKAEIPPYPRIVESNNGYWGASRNCPPALYASKFIPEVGSEEDLRLGNIEMMEYGASKFYEGKCDCVAFDCMPHEVPEIKAYMAEKHPTVQIAFGRGREVLYRARSAWHALHGSKKGETGLA